MGFCHVVERINGRLMKSMVKGWTGCSPQWSFEHGGLAMALASCPEAIRCQNKSGLAVVVMGVSGSGKTTIGKLLAEALSCPFLDADDFHSEENKEKMRNEVPLTDSDRFPWLENLRYALSKYLLQEEQVVLACSALRKSYRDVLRDADPLRIGNNKANQVVVDGEIRLKQPFRNRVVFVYLKSSFEMIASRLEARYKNGEHYMPPSLLKSQIETLEMSAEEQDVITVNVSERPTLVVDSVLSKLRSIRCEKELRDSFPFLLHR